MSSRNLLNVILLLLFVGLLAVAIYEPGKPDDPASQAITSIDLAAVKRLRIESPGRAEIMLQKVGDDWRMLQPYAMPANEGRIQQVLGLTQARSVTSYPLAQVDLQQLQLHKPILVLDIDGQSLRFGTTTALDEKRYVQMGDAVHLITDRYSHLARSAATEFVSPQLLPAGRKITRLKLGAGSIPAEDANAQALIKEWQQVRAQKVSSLEKTATKTERVELHFENAEPLRIDVLKTETEVILQLPDAGLQYHFAAEAGQRLFALPVAEPEKAQ